MSQTADVPETKVRTVRIDDEMWERAQKIAKRRREALSWILKRAIVEYVERYEQEGDR